MTKKESCFHFTHFNNNTIFQSTCFTSSPQVLLLSKQSPVNTPNSNSHTYISSQGNLSFLPFPTSYHPRIASNLNSFIHSKPLNFFPISSHYIPPSPHLFTPFPSSFNRAAKLDNIRIVQHNTKQAFRHLEFKFQIFPIT